MWAIIILVFGGLALKVYWDYGQDQSNKRKAYIRDLEWRGRQISAGLNPDGMPYGWDHSHDLCNANSPCSGCAAVQAKNNKLIERDKKIRDGLLGI